MRSFIFEKTAGIPAIVLGVMLLLLPRSVEAQNTRGVAETPYIVGVTIWLGSR